MIARHVTIGAPRSQSRACAASWPHGDVK